MQAVFGYIITTHRTKSGRIMARTLDGQRTFVNPDLSLSEHDPAPHRQAAEALQRHLGNGGKLGGELTEVYDIRQPGGYTYALPLSVPATV